MRKLLLTAIVALAFFGMGMAQEPIINPNGYETHWPDFFPGQYEMNDYPDVYIEVDGSILTIDDRWYDIEVASFVNGELRGTAFLNGAYPLEDWWPNNLPWAQAYVRYNNSGELVTFKVYDHGTGQEYDVACNKEVHTGEEHIEISMWEFDDAVILSYSTGGGYELPILGYEGDTDNYYLIASPVGNIGAVSVDNLVSNSFDFFSFDQSVAGEEWVNLRETAEEYEMQIGMGYLYANSEDVTLVFRGTPIDDEEFEVELEYDEECATAWKGYNLIGNPYGEAAYLVDGRDFLRMVNGEYVLDDEGGDIEPMEGVFVQAEGEGETVFFAPSSGEMGGDPISGKKCVLNVTAGRGLVDRAVIRFGEARQMTKVQFNSNNSKLYIPQDGEDYAVVRSAEMGEMPVNFKAGESGSYMLSVNPRNVEFNYLHLIDNMTGADVDLLVNPSYSFEANTTDYASRFKLVFATGANDENFAFFSNGGFVISNEGEATLQVIDVTGRILSSETISGSANVHVSAAPGVYMLRLINGDNMKVQKVVVK